MNRSFHPWDDLPGAGSTLLADLRETRQHMRAAAERLQEWLQQHGASAPPERPRR